MKGENETVLHGEGQGIRWRVSDESEVLDLFFLVGGIGGTAIRPKRMFMLVR
jgi:hypothetical protein